MDNLSIADLSAKYNLVDTVEKLKILDKILMDGSNPKFKILAYDTETNGLLLHKSVVVGFSVSYDDKKGWYVPFLVWEKDPKSKKVRTYKKEKYPEHHKDGKLKCIWTGDLFDEFVTPNEYKIKERMPLIPALIERWFGSTNLYMWNAPFDVNMTYVNTGVDLKNNVFLDGALLVHVLDENYSSALKPNAEKYKLQLGLNPHAHAAMEKKELGFSVINNGGKSMGHVWRADIDPQMKYGCADTMFTFGVCQAALKQFSDEFGAEGIDWFFNKEVMPVCKEVVIDMKRRGVFIDVEHFQGMFNDNQKKMDALQDQIMAELNEAKLLGGFELGKSLEESVSNQRFIKRVIELENLAIPVKYDKKTDSSKETLAKGEVKKVYAKDPHWLWGYILGEDEIKYSDAKVLQIKNELYREVEGRRYRFNINSGDHLIWLFCDKLGMDKTKLPQTDTATKEKPRPKMDAEVLTEFMLPKYPWVATLLSWKKLMKMQSTYIKPALVLNIDGWMYMDMKQNGTTSGRFSCSGGYNLQTLPRVDDEMEALEACESCDALTFDRDGNLTGDVDIVQDIECIADLKCNKCGHLRKDIPRPSSIKKGFIAPPGYKIVNADYSSLEPRCFAVMSGEDAIKEVYRKGLDLYSQVYCELFDHANEYSADPKDDNFLKKIAKAKRTFIKPIVLGIPYGSGDAQVANMIGATKEILDKKTGKMKEILDVSEGKRVRDAYLLKFANLNQYMEDQDLKAVKFGYVETIVGRRRHLPYAKRINDVLDEFGIDFKDLRDAPNFSLKGKTCEFVSQSGIKVALTEEVLNKMQTRLEITDEKLKEKENWLYIRNLLKHDLNNAKNNPIQGLAGHITNKGMLDTNRFFIEKNLDAWVCLQVHDEITAYAAIDQADVGAECLKVGMEKNEFTDLLDIPMIADPIVCDTLKEAK